MLNKKFFCVLLILIICISMTFAVIKIKAYKDKEDCLFGKIIYIDAGHGGKDNGANVDDVLEDEINLKISGYLLETLIDSGATVLMSRTNDYDLAFLYQKNRKKEDLNNRVKYINSSKPDLFVSIHLNTYPSLNVEGAQVFYQNNEQSKNLANFIQTELNKLTNKERKTKNGDYFLLNKTNFTGILIECGFLSNNGERLKLNQKQYQMKIAKKIKEGIVNYFYYLSKD